MPSTNSLRERADAFIAEATDRHGGRYRYDKVDFVNATVKVTITCPEHGDFDQQPKEHRRGQACPDCSGRAGSSPAARKAKFVADATALHDGRYDYSVSDFIDAKTAVVITCPDHGEFTQRPTNHLQGKGCPECASTSRVEAVRGRPRDPRALPVRFRGKQGGTALVIRVELLGNGYFAFYARSRPRRDILIDQTDTYANLSAAIEAAFERDDDEHLYEFSDDTRHIVPLQAPGAEWPAGLLDSEQKSLRDLSIGDTFAYRFDFGDEWKHQCKVLASSIDPAKLGQEHFDEAVVIEAVHPAPPQYPNSDDED